MIHTLWRSALVVFVLLAFSVPVDLMAQGRKRGHDKQHKNKQKIERQDRDGRIDGDDRRILRGDDGRVIVIDDDDDDDVLRRRPRRGDDDGGIVLRGPDGRVIVIGDDDVRRRVRARNGNGPPFCRSGAGHPVHGRRWCLDKGWGLGDRDRIFFDDDVIFWDDDRREAIFVRNRRFDDRGDRTLWELLLNGTLALVD